MCLCCGGVVIEQLGDAEVEQLDLAGAVHQHIAGLQVAMNDEVLVRAGHRLADLDEQREAQIHIRPCAFAPRRQRFAFDLFQYQAQAAIRQGQGFDEAGDMRIVQALQRALFVVREVRILALVEALTQHLECHLFTRGLRMRRIDFAHAAASEQAIDDVVADPVSDLPAQQRHPIRR